MHILKRYRSFLSFTALAVISTSILAAPPFIRGQIAVYSSPHQLGDLEVTKFLPNAGISIVTIESGKEWGQIQRLRKQGLKAGLNYLARASKTPNDGYYPYQWHFPAVQSEQAWDITTGAGVKVAVLDTGIVNGGVDGVNICTTGSADIVNGDSDPTDGSTLSHGTHVSGTISQITSFNQTVPAFGSAGLSPGACVMPIKVLNDSGSGSFADIADGIVHAVNNGADVINMSLGVDARYGLTSDAIMDPALDLAYQQGVTVVAAAGNDGYRRNVSYPAIYPSVIAVGATDYRNKLTRYSNKGTGLDVVAPGGDTSRDDNIDGNVDGVLQETIYQGNWGQYLLQGTSMASPHVAAIAALLISNGTTGPDDVFTALSNTTLDLGNSGYDSTYGYGLVQAHDALNYGGNLNPGPPTAATDPTPSDNVVDVSIDTELSWLSDTDADSHHVYFGTTSLALVSEQTGTSYNPGLLNPDTVYQWQIVEVNEYGNTPGAIWTFTTTTSSQCVDADDDGFCISDGDCDDNNSHVYPGHRDTKGRWGRDGVDNDCNGIIDG